jgi:hypothetical protein
LPRVTEAIHAALELSESGRGKERQAAEQD